MISDTIEIGYKESIKIFDDDWLNINPLSVSRRKAPQGHQLIPKFDHSKSTV